MNQSVLTFLPALHGDAFIIHCFKGENEGYVIVDGGPNRNPNLNPFISEVENIAHIDLMIMTHQDDDHLVGIKKYIEHHKDDVIFPVDRLWVNSARFVDMPEGHNLSAVKANSMADTLRKIGDAGKTRWTDAVCADFDTSDITFADIEVIAPSAKTLGLFFDSYEALLSQKGQEPAIDLSASERVEKDRDIDLQTLSERGKASSDPGNYANLVNMASIAFIIRCDGLSALMLGDSFPDEVEAYLRDKGYSEENKLAVDFVKVSHHGSRNNISNTLLDIIDCVNYLIPTNGGEKRSYHPDRETLANILCHKERDRGMPAHFFFNYPLTQIERRVGKLFQDDDAKFNYVIHDHKNELPNNLSIL